jgi:hypothetical protein
MLRTKWIAVWMIAVLTIGALVAAEPVSNEVLLKRIELLENELNQLKQMVKTDPSSAPRSAEPELTLSQSDKERILYLLENDKAGRKNVWSSLDIGVYGYIKLDASYDSSQVSTGNFARWVLPGDSDGDNEFNMTANQTRIGVNITGPTVGSMKTRGNIEVDFFGSNAEENKAKLMMRHAYLSLDWPEEKFSILAGQTWDVISPLNPFTLNYSVLWWSGNIGNRRPQIRLTKGFDLDGGAEMTLAGAVARTIGRDSLVASRESGSDAGYPSLQGRLGLAMPLFEAGKTALGVSGHWGREEYDLNADGDNKKFKTWSVNVDFVQPIAKWLDIRGELFTGENLAQYCGGIGQGVEVNTAQNVFYEEIGSKGGWLAARIKPADKWAFSAGAGMEKVDAGDLNGGDRKMNRTMFVNGVYSINKNTSVGLELAHLRTEYQGGGDAEDIRAQMSFMYNF